MSFWEERQYEFRHLIGDKDFLDKGVIRDSCAVGGWLTDTEMKAAEDPFVRANFNVDDFMLNWGGEHMFGTTMHHLYTLGLWRETTGKSFDDIETVSEFGAGFGNVARLLFKLGVKKYDIHDLEGPSLFQQWFLMQTSFGKPVAWHSKPWGLPVSDMFISMWALSESPWETQREVLASEAILEAPSGILAWQPWKPGFESHRFHDRMLRREGENGLHIVKTDHQESFYAFW